MTPTLRRGIVLACAALLALSGLAFAQADVREFVFARMSDSDDLDPQTATGGMINHRVTINIFEPLVWVDEEVGEIVGVLAESWDIIDELTWEFRLRQGVTFHNGEPFNAEAVKFTYERVTDPDFQTTDKFPTQVPLDRVEVIDDYTVRVVTTEPVPVLLSHLSRNGGFMLAPGHYRDLPQDQASTQPVGTGPFKFVSWTRDDRIVLEANDDYWRGRPEIDRLVIRAIPEASTRVAELRTGGVHAIMDVPPDFIPEIEAAPGISVVAVEGFGRKHLGINQEKHEALQDPLVRRAIQHAIDVDTLIIALRDGLTSRMATMVNPPNDHPGLGPFAYDPELARSLLAEAGYPDGFTITLGAGTEPDTQLALAVAQNLNEVGITVADVEVWEWGQYVTVLGERNLPALYVLLFGGAENTPETDMWAIHPDRQTNSTNWFDQEWYDTYAELAVTFDPDRRQELNYRLQEIMHEQNPWLWLWRDPLIFGISDAVHWVPRADDHPYFYGARFLDD
jgi:peptide/nickel transport system substrate-binding protein